MGGYLESLNENWWDRLKARLRRHLRNRWEHLKAQRRRRLPGVCQHLHARRDGYCPRCNQFLSQEAWQAYEDAKALHSLAAEFRGRIP